MWQGGEGRGILMSAHAVLPHPLRELLGRQLATVSALTTTLSHGIKNHMAGIQAAIEVLESGANLSSDDRFVLTLLADEVRSLSKTIRELVDTVRIDIGAFESIGVDLLIQGSAESLKEVILERDITVDVAPGPECVEVTVDRRAMEQSLANVLRNALEASGKGARVSVGWSVMEKQEQERLFPAFTGRVLSIYGEDEGVGLPSDLSVADLFRPLTTTNESKVGLGLPVARHIVELHGGILQLSAIPSGGARFEILLPLPGRPLRCWDQRSVEICALDYCEFRCEGCETRSNRILAPCWAVKGQEYVRKEGLWPPKCLSCPLLQTHFLHLF